ncbi:2-aminoethylphosphonate--pyruvate transaminase [Eubacterium sp. 1001713B170207_170306_E7]|uniref:2-aminoethylphosphonate--pyruvate transaminase n=1 Tax=Eubacterium sp. 1001713B170207_170306_E7 TaxID=2787097 RepID=UPI00189BD099|nr:2-aminoethylphosphonate--pyruvate transaminase [Eubacterium sp. 1001713B170207_170306_E7]
MEKYKLLTPGPLTTSDAVKAEMLFDHCTWDNEYKAITQRIRAQLLKIAHVGEDTHTAILMQGSGTFGVEAVLSSVIGDEDKVLFITNGAYGERMLDIASYHRLKSLAYNEAYDKIPDAAKVRSLLEENPDITHVAMVHCETTTGILNDIHAIGELCAQFGKTYIVDAMSSFGGIDIPVEEHHIDFMISSANKCIQGVPGFSFIIARTAALQASKGKARSLSLDIYDQWETMNRDGKWRFTSPTHTVLAFSKALDELEERGGVEARYQRYASNNKLLVEKMAELGIHAYIDEPYRSPIITTFLYPQQGFDFTDMYNFVKARGYAIYPGKLTRVDTFRMGNIGEIYQEDIENLYNIFYDYLKQSA